MVTLYDPSGRKIDLGALRQEESAPSLRSVRQVFSSNPSNGLTPQRLASIFKQADMGNPHAQCELFEEMEEKDLHLRMPSQKNISIQLIEIIDFTYKIRHCIT